MPRYITRESTPRAFWVEDDVDYGPADFGIPTVCDHNAVDTGLCDASGNTIWRAPDPIGFDFERLK